MQPRCRFFGWLFLYHTNQDPKRPRCRTTRLRCPPGYGLAADFQHPRGGRHETRRCCFCTCERHTPLRFWGAFVKSLPLQTSTTASSSVQFFQDDQPTLSLATWPCVVTVPSRATRPASRTRQLAAFNDCSYRTLAPRHGDNRGLGELTLSLQ